MTKKHHGLQISIALHIIVLLFAIVKVRFFAPQIIDLSQAIHVDMVGLPDKYTQEQISQAALNEDAPVAKTQSQETVKEEPKKTESVKNQPQAVIKEKPKDESVNLNKSKSKQKAALDKLKQLSALEKIKNSVNAEKAQKTQTPTRVLIKGRVISKGTSLTGLDRLQADDFILKLDAKIKQHWQLPGFLIDKPLKAQVLLKLNTDGSIASKKIQTSSGNSTYDDYCLAAIEKSAPFPKVPEKFSEIFLEDGLLVGFPE